MKVRNTTDGYLGFTARLNPGEKVKGHDPLGNAIVKDALPILKSVRIPPLATVEVEDALWRSATKSVAKRQGVQLAKDPVQLGTDDPEAKAKHYITTPIGDNVFKSFNPVLDMVKLGLLEIVEHAQTDMTLEQMRAAVEKAQGYPLPKEVDEELVIAQYHRICE